MPLRSKFCLIIDSGKTERQACALDHRLVTQHSARVRFPRRDVALALCHVLGDDNRVRTVFAVDRARTGFVILLEIHAVELRVVVDDPRPAVNADHRNNAVVAVRERVQLAGEWVKPILLRDDA